MTKSPIGLSIAEHASKHSIFPLKKYGQNFIFDTSLCDKIVKASGLNSGDIALEIGPGTAGLTRSILACSPKSLTIVETDIRCFDLLQELQGFYSTLNIIKGDALQFELSSLNSDKIHIISNLPYNIGTELVIKWLRKASLISSMTLMLQKEVVDRMRAEVSTKAYGRLSVICQLVCNVEKCFDVSPAAFYPPPKVHSSIVKLTPLSTLIPIDVFSKIELITRLAFGQRRKMLKSSLKDLTPNIENLLQHLSISSTNRAENLSPENYLSLAENLPSLK